MKKKVIILYIMLTFIIIFVSIKILTMNDNNNRYIKGKNNIYKENDIIENTEIEDYLKGVVAAEMPALFEFEALKAQAVASRTYILKHINDRDCKDFKNLKQSYITIDDMKKKWGKNFEKYYDKISRAVDDTCGEILVYNSEPIEAVFHAMSAGKTEKASEVWKKDLPYLQTVNSKFDEDEKDFINEKVYSKKEFYNKIKNYIRNINFSSGVLDEIEILNYTDAGYVKTVKVGDKIVKGTEFRNMLNLKSTNFYFYIKNENINFVTKGYGHCVGMSQTGANFLAKKGYSYKDILKYYYLDVNIE